MVFGGKAANYAVPIVVGTQTLGLLKARLRDHREKQNQGHSPQLASAPPCILCELEMWLLGAPRLTFPSPNSREKLILVFSDFKFKHLMEGFQSLVHLQSEKMGVWIGRVWVRCHVQGSGFHKKTVSLVIPNDCGRLSTSHKAREQFISTLFFEHGDLGYGACSHHLLFSKGNCLAYTNDSHARLKKAYFYFPVCYMEVSMALDLISPMIVYQRQLPAATHSASEFNFKFPRETDGLSLGQVSTLR